jgi:hypothetical protein
MTFTRHQNDIIGSLASASAVLIASFRSLMVSVFRKSCGGTPFFISSMIASGSSFLGLSEVNITRSLNLQAISAMMGLFSLSRLPPQPITVITCSFLVLIPESSLEHCSVHQGYVHNPGWQ